VLTRTKNRWAPVPAIRRRPEAELLLCCARSRLDAPHAEQLRRLLGHDLAWPYLLRLAALHGLLPLLYWHLHTTWPDAVPPETLALLRDYFHANALHTRLLTQELLTLLQLFAAHGLPALPFTGPTLAVSAYGHLAFRQFHDLDILVHQHDLRQATALLTAQGYQRTHPPAEDARVLREQYHWHLTRDAGRLHVELHWAFTPPYWAFPLDLARLWDRLEPVALAGTTVGSVPPADLVLILSAHGAKHYWGRLSWICDIAELCRAHPQLEWGRVLAQARALRCERILLLALRLAQDLLGSPLPAPVRPRVAAHPGVPALAAQVGAWVLAGAEDAHQASDRQRLVRAMAQHRLYLRMREGFPDKVRYVRHYLPGYVSKAITPTAKDRALLPLPRPLTCLYYLLHPLRVLWEYGLRRAS
jgi:hypothetical protein